ncbi:MAG: VWA domain-containing protein, partial [Cyclobacteriaceae bacterium]
VICDVSKSMDLYSQFLIQFLYAFQYIFRSIETFIFSSSIYRVTPYLKDHEFREALALMGEEVVGWSGGTCIGSSLETLISRYKPMINSHTYVLILSDGWDDGDLKTLEDSMRLIHRKANRIIWLNPLMANPDFSPQTGGMKTALPYVDMLHPCHNLESLSDFVATLK